MSRKVALESEKDIDRRGGSRPAGEARSAVPAGKEGRREGGAPRPRCFPRRAAPKRLPRPRLLLSLSFSRSSAARAAAAAAAHPSPPLFASPSSRYAPLGEWGTCQALNNHITRGGGGAGGAPSRARELTSRGGGGGGRRPRSPGPTPFPAVFPTAATSSQNTSAGTVERSCS